MSDGPVAPGSDSHFTLHCIHSLVLIQEMDLQLLSTYYQWPFSDFKEVQSTSAAILSLGENFNWCDVVASKSALRTSKKKEHPLRSLSSAIPPHGN